jgi:hypothetical protein
MYTDEDLNNAVGKGIFTESAVTAFRADVLASKQTQIADEEDFKLLTSFNDIFVVIACSLLLLSAAWVIEPINEAMAYFVVAGLSWLLAEFFVIRRKMALPAIVLLVSFVGAIFSGVLEVTGNPLTEESLMAAGFVATLAAWLHWRRFHVPITVAAGTAAAVSFVVALLLSLYPPLDEWLMTILFVGGLVVFALAMRWDSADLKRVTGKSDVAFWLHLMAAPMIVHPVFSSLGIFEGNQSLSNGLVVLALYLVVTTLSLTIDRRAFMVSALIYVLVALTELLEDYGLEGDTFAYVGVVIGFSLLMLSGFWGRVRAYILNFVPASVRALVPETH